jgi:hypothetical protein
MFHHHGHAIFQSLLAKAGQQRDLIGTGEIRNKHIGTGARQTLEQAVDFKLARAKWEILLTDHVPTEPQQCALGRVDGPARPLIIISRKNIFKPKWRPM